MCCVRFLPPFYASVRQLSRISGGSQSRRRRPPDPQNLRLLVQSYGKRWPRWWGVEGRWRRRTPWRRRSQVWWASRGLAKPMNTVEYCRVENYIITTVGLDLGQRRTWVVPLPQEVTVVQRARVHRKDLASQPFGS